MTSTAGKGSGDVDAQSNSLSGTKRSRFQKIYDAYRQDGRTDWTGLQYVKENNPISDLMEAKEYILDDIAERGFDIGAFGLDLKFWAGALDGIVHQAGQFSATGEASQKLEATSTSEVPDDGLLEDLDFVASLRDHTSVVTWSSESDFSVHPLIVKLDEETGKKLTQETLFKALGIPATLSSTFKPPVVFDTAAEFIRHMATKPELGGEDGDLEEVEEAEAVDPVTVQPEGPVQRQARAHAAYLKEMRRGKAGFKKAAEMLASYCEPPYMEAMAGDEDWYNPIPVFWVGKTKHGNAVGVMSAVVWT